MSKFPQYTVDYISQAMSLRKPQKESLIRLDNILSSLNLRKGLNLKAALSLVHGLYGTCTDFEHSFMSLAFSLATGVGKTRLMGAFITYLYTQHNIKNFFIVAPNTTIFEKLKADLGMPGSSKYVFTGLGCFNNPPTVVTDDDYRNKQIQAFPSGITLFIYNIDKFNKETAKMNQTNENLGESFTSLLSKLEDLVVIMDESHHYRADKGFAALNDLNPLLGLELTATPKYNNGNRQVTFKNVIYEYPLSQAIADGYTRTPYALTRANMPKGAFGEKELDRLMISDGIKCHERTRKILKDYAVLNNKKLVKPFMLIVCKDTSHADEVYKYVTSDDFRDGYYAYKTIIVHSQQKGSESDENTKRLLSVESSDEPTEIVIHVNKLKEGWDVNNLYTIVPLRSAASDILKEQMVGRGLRLPYGVRTGNKDIDAVMLTAHDKFKEILEAAQKGDSIFKAGNIVQIEDLENEKTVVPDYSNNLFKDEEKEEAYRVTGMEKNASTNLLLDKTAEIVENVVSTALNSKENFVLDHKSEIAIAEQVKTELSKDKDLAEVFKEYQDPLSSWIAPKISNTYKQIREGNIPIPLIKITDEGVDEFHFMDFDLDCSDFNYVPIDDSIVIQNLIDQSQQEILSADKIDLNINPKKEILKLLREKPELDYERHGELIRKLITQFCDYFESRFGANGMRNIVLMNKKDITNRIYAQMLLDEHSYCDNSLFKEEVSRVRQSNIKPQYDKITTECDLYEDFKEKTEGSIKSVLFTGIKKGVFSSVKFDSMQELVLARILERDKDVIHWLRPAPTEFNLKYNHGKTYVPDFVIEAEDIIYLTEVKDASKVNSPDVLAKKARGIRYCAIASEWGKANGYKKWQYLFIPHDQISITSTFATIIARFAEDKAEFIIKSDFGMKEAANKPL